MRVRPLKTLFVCMLGILSTQAMAQTIEKMKLTDGELTCTQLYAESSQMDTVIRASQSMAPASPAPAAAPQMIPGGNNTSAIMQANNLTRQDLVTTQQLMLQSRDVRVRAAASDPQAVAQYAVMLRNPQLAVAAQRAAAAGVSPAYIQSQINIAAAAQAYAGGAAAAQVSSQQAVAPAVAPSPAQTGLAQQAMARKEHLTGLFLNKGCKLSEIQR